MRQGQNPAKRMTSVPKPKKVTVAILNYIPFQSGFYANMLDVLKSCLGSIWANTDMEHDLLVFDNGSCTEVKDYLVEMQTQGKIQYLILSDKNIGKGGAWNVMLSAAPGEIIAYADNDVYFYPDWLSRSIEVLETFPNAGMVTARPFRTREALYTNTLKWASTDPDVQMKEGQFVPWNTFLEFNLSLGDTENDIRNVYESTKDIRVEYKGVTAQVGASHWQFTTRKEIVSRFLPFQMDRPMGQVLQLDELINEAGYLRLMVPEPLTMNMSNTLPTELLMEPNQLSRRNNGIGKKFLKFRLVEGIFMKIYNQIFRWYNS
jgi:glycosyltransferase involved in cell wall biosynthesis